MGKKVERKSNIEFLRIIAMTFIVIGHIVLHGTHNSVCGSSFIRSITTTGVDLFVMISGYFCIRLSPKSLFNIIGTVLFYSIINILLCMLIFKQSLAIKEVIGVCLPMSLYGTYWFVSCYLMLMLLSPAINIVLEKTSNRRFLGILAIVAYISCVSGWLFRNPINDTGFTTFNMVFIYLLGHGIRRFNLSKRSNSYIWLALYIFCTFILNVLLLVLGGQTLHYNSPILILASVSLFCVVLNFNFFSKTINAIALCMFPVYLIQDGYFGQHFYDILYDKGVEYHFGGIYFCYIIIYFVTLFAVSYIMEYLRKRIMTKPVRKLSVFFSNQCTSF